MKGITQNVYQNKELVKICQNVIESARDIMIFDTQNCEEISQSPPGQNLIENKQVLSYDVSIGQYVDEKAGIINRERAFDTLNAPGIIGQIDLPPTVTLPRIGYRQVTAPA
jgi:hypothetical protein